MCKYNLVVVSWFIVNLILLGGVFFASICNAEDVDDDEEKIQQKQMDIMTLEEYKKTCGKGFDIDEYGPTTISTPLSNNGKYATGIDCEWSIIGHRGCLPQLRCSHFDMRKLGKDCVDEFLAISDGLGEKQTLCGNVNPLNTSVTTSEVGAYELYVTLKISKSPKFNKKYKGFKCIASCGVGVGVTGVGQRLPKMVNSDRKIDSTCTCGLKSEYFKAMRVIGGKNAALNEFPWQAAMVDKGTRQLRCGASLINDRYALTAAHCIFNGGSLITANDIDILLHAQVLDKRLLNNWNDVPLGQHGSIQSPGWNLSEKTDADENTIRLPVTKIITHPAYDDVTLDYDISLLLLGQTVSMNDKKAPVGPVCLPPQGMKEKNLEGKLLTVVGWGLADEKAGATTRLLQKLDVPFRKIDDCEKINKRNLTDRMQCAGFEEGGKDSCTGDSGGPLLADGEGETPAVQVGIVSFGTGCARKNMLGIYTRVSELVQWIYHNSKGAVWCQGSGQMIGGRLS